MMLEEIHAAFQNNAELFTVAGFLAGTLAGNYFSIERDKRKEFNDVVSPIYFLIKQQIESRSLGVENFDPDVIEHHLPWYKKNSFRKSVEGLRKVQNEVSEYNFANSSVTVNEAAHSEMLKHAKDVLRHLKPR